MTDRTELLSLQGLRPFRPRARYNHGLDVLVYRAEAGLNVADRVDEFLTVLWDRDLDHLVGIRIKGLRYIFNQLKESRGWSKMTFLPLVTVLEAIVEEFGGELMEAASQLTGPVQGTSKDAEEDAADRAKKYALARSCVESVHLTRDQLQELAGV